MLASITYNMGIFTPMKNFLLDLEAHGLSNRCFALIENGSWSPAAGRLMKEILDRLEGVSYAGETVRILSSPDADDAEALSELADAVAASVLSGSPEAAEDAPASNAWVCKLCGYVYEGEELPEDYTCPLCGANASFFERRED